MKRTGDRVWRDRVCLRQGNRGTGSMSNKGMRQDRVWLRQGNRGTSSISNRGQGQDRVWLRQGNRGTEESNRGGLSLTELHRRTEHTKAHRDIKSTDNTERYSYWWVLGVNC